MMKVEIIILSISLSFFRREKKKMKQEKLPHSSLVRNELLGKTHRLNYTSNDTLSHPFACE